MSKNIYDEVDAQIDLALENKKLKKQIEELSNQNTELREVLADMVDMIVLLSKKKSIKEKAKTSVASIGIRGGKFRIASKEIIDNLHERDAIEKGHKYYNGMNKSADKTFIDDKENKIRSLLKDPKVQISSDPTSYSIGKSKPEELTTATIFRLIEKVNGLE